MYKYYTNEFKMADILSDDKIQLPKTNIDEVIYELNSILYAALPVSVKNYQSELKRKKHAVLLFKEIEKEYKKIKKRYDEFIERFYSKIDSTLCVHSTPVTLKYKKGLPENVDLCKEENTYLLKINNKLLHGNIGNVLPNYEALRIKKCVYRSTSLCRRPNCPFYHEEQQRNFKRNTWERMITNGATLEEEITLFKKKPLKDKQEIIEEHMAFTMHNLLILLTLMENSPLTN